MKYKIASGQWQRLRVSFRDSIFVVYCNEERLFDVEDHTFVSAGKTGVWTKADSLTYFDDFTVSRKDQKR